MKRIALMLAALLLLLSSAAAETSRVVDNAGMLTSSDVAILETAIADIRVTYDFDVVLLVEDTIGGRDIAYYAADYYDYGGFGVGENRDGIMLIVVKSGRQYYILNTGRGEKIFDYDTMIAMEDNFIPYLKVNNYTSAMGQFVKDVLDQLATYTPAGRAVKRANKLLPILLGVGAAAGLVVALILKGQMRTVRRKQNAASYVRDGSFHLTRAQDLYLYTTTVRHKIQTQSSGGFHGGGHGGGFTGSSGMHHTGHGGKF